MRSHPADGAGAVEVVRLAGDFTDVDLAIDRGAHVVVLGLNGAGKTTLLRVLSGTEAPDTGEVLPGHGLRLGYYAQEHDTLDTDRTVLENMRSSSPDLPEPEARRVLGSFLFSGDVVHQQAGTLSGGEKTRLALATLVVSGSNVLLLDEPTNNLDPASREEVLGALQGYKGAVVLVTHDEGAVVALQPEKVLLLPDGSRTSGATTSQTWWRWPDRRLPGMHVACPLCHFRPGTGGPSRAAPCSRLPPPAWR